MQKEQEAESQDAKVVQVQTTVPSLTRPFVYCGNNAVLAPAAPHPASQIPPSSPQRRSPPGPFPSHPQGSAFPNSETLSNLGHEKQVQSLSLAASPSPFFQDTHMGDRSPLPTQSLTLESSSTRASGTQRSDSRRSIS